MNLPIAAPSPERMVDLLRSAQRGEAHALERLLVRLQPPITRFLAARARGAPDPADFVEEVRQDALVEIAKYYETCTAQEDGQLMRWMLIIVRQRALRYLPAYRPPGLTRILSEDLHGAFTDEYSGPIDDIEDVASAKLFQLAFVAYTALAGDVATLIWERLVLGMTWREIATEHRTTEGGAKLRYQRAQDALRRSVSAQLERLSTEERAILARELEEREHRLTG
jgi:DNA-directed RNA polymerase specialized sigma24 family protein